VSDPTQSPSPGEPPDADDAPAAIGPDQPTLAHPVTGDAATADLSGAAGFPSAEPAPEAAIPVPPPEPDAPPPPAVPGDPVPHSEPLPAAPPVSAAPDSAPVSPPPPPPPVAPVPPPPVTPLGADDAGGSGGPAAAVMAAAQERPELAVGASFAGGLVLAMILKRLAR
jgi:hypothetical protein